MESGTRAASEAPESGTASLTIDPHELATVLGLTKRAVNKRASQECWRFEKAKGRGPGRRAFLVSSLPVDIQRRVLAAQCEVPAELAECLPASGADPDRAKECLSAWEEAPEGKRERARIRLEVVRALEEFKARTERGIRPFIKEYGERKIKLGDEVYKELPTVTRSKLAEWVERYQTDGIAGLVSRKGSGIPKTLIPREQQQFILGLVAQNAFNGPTAIWQAMKAKFRGQSASLSAVKRYTLWQREENPALWRYLESPDEYKNRYQLALGSSSAKAGYFLHWLEIDSTPADVMCNDNRRYTIIGLIDIFSRKCKFMVTLTSNSWGIAALLRTTFLDWGLCDNLVKDNGQDYASKMVNDALDALGVNCPKVPAFTPEAKPHVERSFRTLAHGLQERLAGFIGHNVAQRKAIESRKSFADRLGKRGETVELGLAPQELQRVVDEWVESVYHQRRHSGIHMSPNAKAASVAHLPRRIDDPRVLDILLAPSGTRTVGKKGVRYEGGSYWDNELIDWVGRKVLVRTEVVDAGRIFCFDPNSNRFICEAQDLALSGITVGEMIEAKKRANKRVKARAKALMRLASEVGDPVADELAAARARTRLLNLPVGAKVEGNPFVDGAREAIQAREAEQARAREGEAEQYQLEMDRAAYRLLGPSEPEETDPNVIRLPVPRQSTEIEADGRYFANARKRFEWLMTEQRARPLTPAEYQFLEDFREEWEGYSVMFWNGWDEEDKQWILSLAPHLIHRIEKRQEK
ncbi:MAG: Mu transposase C-terminal domain-containing protein [Thermodesulfobacteriota bacterium]